VNKKLLKEIKTLNAQNRELAKEVKKIKKLEFMKVFKHPIKFIWFSFLKGLMIGFGSVLGASVLVAVFIYLLSTISFVPFIGDFVQDVIDEVANTTNQTEVTHSNEQTTN